MQSLVKIIIFRRNSSSTNGGELMLGGSNPAYYTGNFVFTPVIEKNVWMFRMDGYKQLFFKL